MIFPLILLAALGCDATKDGDDTGDSAAEAVSSTHCDPITSDEVWTAARSPHRVLCDLDIDGAVVTIEAGVTVELQDGVSVHVGRGGAASGLLIEGSASAPVVFDLLEEVTEDDSALGWGGLAFYGSTVAAELHELTLRRGGNELDAALRVEGAEVLLDGVRIEDSLEHGLRVTEGGRVAEGSSGLAISGSAGWSARVDADAAHTLPTAGSDYSGNEGDGVVIDRATITEDVSWADLGVPWVISGVFEVDGSAAEPAALRVAAGSQLLFEEGAGVSVAPTGGSASLFIGEAGGEEVSLTPLTGTDPGTWAGIEAAQGTLAVELHSVRMEQGGDGDRTGAALFVAGDVDVVLDEVSLAGSLGYGVYLFDGARLSEDSGALTITECGEWPVRIQADVAHTLPPSSYTGNASDGVLVDGHEIADDVSWEPLGVPYVVSGDIYLNGHRGETSILTIEAGTALLFDARSGILLANDGGESGFHAAGTEAEPILMTALLADDEGFWDGVYAQRGVPDGSVSLRHVDMSWGGTTNFAAMIKAVDTEVYVEEVSLTRSNSYGFLLAGDARFAEGSRGLTLEDNYEDGEITAGAVHTLPEDLVFAGVTSSEGRSRGYHALFVTGTTDPEGEVTWPQLDGAAYWIVNSFSLEGSADRPAILTLLPGTQLWMGDNTAIYVSINGGAAGFIASGTAAEPILFIPAEAPVKGRWQGIKIYTHCLDEQTVFEHVTIAYAGGVGDILPDANLVLNGCDATMNEVTIEHSDDDGVKVYGSPTWVGGESSSNDGCGINVLSGDPPLSGISFRSNGAGDVCY